MKALREVRVIARGKRYYNIVDVHRTTFNSVFQFVSDIKDHKIVQLLRSLCIFPIWLPDAQCNNPDGIYLTMGDVKRFYEGTQEHGGMTDSAYVEFPGLPLVEVPLGRKWKTRDIIAAAALRHDDGIIQFRLYREGQLHLKRMLYSGISQGIYSLRRASIADCLLRGFPYEYSAEDVVDFLKLCEAETLVEAFKFKLTKKRFNGIVSLTLRPDAEELCKARTHLKIAGRRYIEFLGSTPSPSSLAVELPSYCSFPQQIKRHHTCEECRTRTPSPSWLYTREVSAHEQVRSVWMYTPSNNDQWEVIVC